MKREKIEFKSGKHFLVGIKDIPDRTPTSGVILFHGLTNSKEDCPLINETAEMLVEEGFIAFRFDFFGSGESQGKMKEKTYSIMLQNAKDAIRYFSKDKRVRDIGLWGRSTGGSIVALCGDEPSIKVFVLVSPGILVEKGFGRFSEIKKQELRLEEGDKKLPGTGVYKGAFDLCDNFFKELGTIQRRILSNLNKMSNVLVIGSTPDSKVPLEHSTTVMNYAKDPREIHIFENVDHDYAGQEKSVVEIERRWFKKFLGKK